MAAWKGCVPAGQAEAFRPEELGMKVLNASLKVFLCTSMHAKVCPPSSSNPALAAGAALFFILGGEG